MICNRRCRKGEYADKDHPHTEMPRPYEVRPRNDGLGFGKILKELSNREILVWVDSIKEHATPFMLKKLISTARFVLPIDRWQMIRGKFLSPAEQGNKAAA